MSVQSLSRVLYFAGWVVEVLVRLPHERQYRRIPKTDRQGQRSGEGSRKAVSRSLRPLGSRLRGNDKPGRSKSWQ